jgi:hypothetical protein
VTVFDARNSQAVPTTSSALACCFSSSIHSMRRFYVGWKARLGLPLLLNEDEMRRERLARRHRAQQTRARKQIVNAPALTLRICCWSHPERADTILLTDKGAEFVVVELKQQQQQQQQERHEAIVRYLNAVRKDLRVFDRRQKVWWLHRSQHKAFATFLEEEHNYQMRA